MARFPIQAFVGPNGSGKSYLAVMKSCVPAWAHGRPVYSNMALFPEVLGFAVELAQPLTSLDSFAGLSDCVVLFDEISSVLPSREFAGLGPDFLRRINQLRKADVNLVWTAPAWARADVSLREVTQAVTVCRSYITDPYQRARGSGALWRPFGKKLRDERGRPLKFATGWPPKCFFLARTFSTEQVAGDWTEEKIRGVKCKEMTRHWRPFSQVGWAYSTYSEVGLFDHLRQATRCITCGGKRPDKRCVCKEDDANRVAV